VLCAVKEGQIDWPDIEAGKRMIVIDWMRRRRVNVGIGRYKGGSWKKRKKWAMVRSLRRLVALRGGGETQCERLARTVG
jgi:hypothetical protein